MPKVVRKQYEEMTVKELRDVAKNLEVVGRWEMTKKKLLNAIDVALGALDDTNGVKVDQKGKDERLNNLKLGVIIAFKCSNGKVKSAKVEKKSTSMRKLQVVTSYGEEHLVDFEDVIWIRTGSRWPRGVYNLLKGNQADEKENKVG